MTEAERLAMLNLWHTVEFLIKELELGQQDQHSPKYHEIKAVHEFLQEGHREFLASGGNTQ